MSRRVTGAALCAKVEREVRRELSDDYGLPMTEYTTTDSWADSTLLGPGYQPEMGFIFTRGNGRTIQVYGISPADDGTIDSRAAAVEFR